MPVGMQLSGFAESCSKLWGFRSCSSSTSSAHVPVVLQRLVPSRQCCWMDMRFGQHIISTWGSLAIFFLALGLGEVLHLGDAWKLLSEGTGIGFFRLVFAACCVRMDRHAFAKHSSAPQPPQPPQQHFCPRVATPVRLTQVSSPAVSHVEDGRTRHGRCSAAQGVASFARFTGTRCSR